MYNHYSLIVVSMCLNLAQTKILAENARRRMNIDILKEHNEDDGFYEDTEQVIKENKENSQKKLNRIMKLRLYDGYRHSKFDDV